MVLSYSTCWFSFFFSLSILDALPEGLTRELPAADEFQKFPAAEPATATFDDIEELRKQLDALNADWLRSDISI